MADISIRSRKQVADALKQFLMLEQHDEAARLQRDLENIADCSESKDVLEQRVRENRIYAALNAIAAEFGPDCVYSVEIDNGLKESGFTDFERDKVRHRLERGFAREVFKPGSSVAGVPPMQFLERIFAARGIGSSDETLKNFLEMLARHRRDLLAQSAEMYADASSNLSDALAKLAPNLVPRRSIDGVSIPAPPWASADACARGEFHLDIVDDGINVEPVLDDRFVSDVELFSQSPLRPVERLNSAAAPSASVEPPTDHDGDLPSSEAISKVHIAARPAIESPAAPSNAEPDAAEHAEVESADQRLLNRSTDDDERTKPQASDPIEVLWRFFTDDKVQSTKWGKPFARQSYGTMRMWREIIGDTRPLNIGTADAQDFSRVILGLPADYSKSEEWRGMTLRAIRKEYKAGTKGMGKKPLSFTTINRHFSVMTVFHEWLVKNELVPETSTSPFAKLWVDNTGVAPMKGGSKPRKMWEEGKLRELLHSPAFTGCKSEARRAKPGKFVFQDAFYWVILLTAYSGARREEICQLKVWHFKKEIDPKTGEVIWYIDLKATDLELKRPESARWVPLHRDVLALAACRT